MAGKVDDGSMVEVLRRRARDEPTRVAYTFLRNGESDEVSWTHEELDRRASRLARRLASVGSRVDRVLLMYPPGLDFLAAFFGCLYAGAVAVPAPTPRPHQSLGALEALASDCGAELGLTTRSFAEAVQQRGGTGGCLDRVHWMDTDTDTDTDTLASPTPPDNGGSWPGPLASGVIAYLQYTSGSTSAPRGVVMTHKNLMHNLRIIREATGASERSVFVGWLPLFHDMGLVTIALQSLYAGGRCVLFSPIAFLQDPLRWLRAITRHAATSSGAPNFAYDLCARAARPDRCAGLDLGHWAMAYNAAEPVRAETLARFSETFAPYGFRPEAFFPCYGLAEATVFVTGGDHEARPVVRRFDPSGLERGHVAMVPQGEDRGRTLVGCGRPWGGQRVLAVDPETCLPSPPGYVGEIWVEGPSVARGYWGRPGESEATFDARLGDGQEGRFLRTGDLGFVHEGELYLVGRKKDLIIIRGSNYPPQDIEDTAQHAHPALRPGGGAAIAAEIEGEERLILVHEVRRESRSDLDVRQILGDLRERIAAEHGLRLHALVLIKTASLPRTTSGKVRRHACLERLRDGTLDVWGADYGNPDCRLTTLCS